MNGFYVEFCGFQERLYQQPLLLINDPVTGNTVCVDTDGSNLMKAIPDALTRSRARWGEEG